MGLEIWRAEAPSNIALIKYMGKADVKVNQPANSSLSYTLDHLVSVVELEPSAKGLDSWAPLDNPDLSPLTLSAAAQDRFIDYFRLLKSEFQIPGHYYIRSANNFPSDCGLASSASSFSALTKATFALALERGIPKEVIDSFTVEDLAALSRRGSGSSCRSFFRPWALWRGGNVEVAHLPFAQLHHQVIILEKGKKLVSSSDAHRRVVSSALFPGRSARAENRLGELLSALTEQNWPRAFEIVWSEFWDMHALFETSEPSFGYMSSRSVRVLEIVRNHWRKMNDGPLVTMDAGANVHLLYRLDQSHQAEAIARDVREFAEVISSPSLVGESP